MVLGRSQKQIGVWQPTTKVARLGGKRRDVPPGWELRRPEREAVFRIRTGWAKVEGFQVARGATAGVGHIVEVVRWVASKESLTYETGDLKTLDG